MSISNALCHTLAWFYENTLCITALILPNNPVNITVNLGFHSGDGRIVHIRNHSRSFGTDSKAWDNFETTKSGSKPVFGPHVSHNLASLQLKFQLRKME